MSESNPDIQRTAFEAEMQKLADEVEKQASTEPEDAVVESVTDEEPDLESRIKDLENRLAQTDRSGAVPDSADSSSLEQVVALLTSVANEAKRRNSLETANQKLFDALHGELKSYKDNFLLDALQRPIIRDLMVHYDDVVRLASQARSIADAADADKESPGDLSALASNLENNVHSIVEIFHRLDVTRIEDATTTFDKLIHRAVRCEPAATPDEDGTITEQVRDGFRWKNTVLRPVDVVVKKTNCVEDKD